MKAIYTLKDGLFPVDTVKELSIAVYQMFEDAGADPDVKVCGDEVVVSVPDVKDIDAEEDHQVSTGFFLSRFFNKALKTAKMAVARRPWVWRYHWSLALTYLHMGDRDAALESAMAALRFGPREIFAILCVGRVYIEMFGEIDKGLSYYQRAYEFYPDSEFVRAEYQLQLTVFKRNPGLQLELSRRAVSDHPDNFYTLAMLMNMLQTSKRDWPEAFRVGQAAVRSCRDPKMRELSVRAGVLHELKFLAIKVGRNQDVADLVELKRCEVERACGRSVRIVKMRGSLDVVHTLGLLHSRESEVLVRYCGARKFRCVIQYFILQELEKDLMALETAKRAGGHELSLLPLPGAGRVFVSDRPRAGSDGGSSMRRKEDDVGKSELRSAYREILDFVQDFFVRRRLFEKHPEVRPLQYYVAMVESEGVLDDVERSRKKNLPGNLVLLRSVCADVLLSDYRDLLGLDECYRLSMRPEDRKLSQQVYEMLKGLSTNYEPGLEWVAISRMIGLLGFDPYYAVVGLEHVSSERNVSYEAISRHFLAAAVDFNRMSAGELMEVSMKLLELEGRGIDIRRSSGYVVGTLGELSGAESQAYCLFAMRNLMGSFNWTLREAGEAAERQAKSYSGKPSGKLKDRKPGDPPPQLDSVYQNRLNELSKAFDDAWEEFCLSDLIDVDYVLQGRCAHCSTGRREASACRECRIKSATDQLEALMQRIFKDEKGTELPTWNIPKSLNRPALALDGLRTLTDRVVRIKVKDMLDANDCLKGICTQCKDHHPDRTANGKCKACVCSSAQKALNPFKRDDGPLKCDPTPLSQIFTTNLCEF